MSESALCERPQFSERFDRLSAPQKDEVARELCKTNLKFLCRQVLLMRDWDKCHDELAIFLSSSQKQKKIILMPRGHLKSSIVTIGWTIQQLLNNFDTTILLANAVWDNARSFLSEIKEYLTSKSFLPRIFGEFCSDKWTQDDVTVRQRTQANKTPTYATAGADKALTSQHYKIIVADDIINRQTIGTDDQRDKSRKFYSDMLDLLEPGGQLVIIGTRWHDGDLYGSLQELEADKFDVYSRGATESGEIDGQVIFPKKFSTQILKDLLKAKGSFEFNAQYFNRCISVETQHFRPPVRYWSEIPEGSVHAITLDPATSESKDACDAVVLDACIAPGNQLMVVEYCAFQKKDPSLIMDKIFEYFLKYLMKSKGEHKVGVEVNGGQEIWIKLLEEEMRKRNVFFQLVPIRQHIDKFSRIIALQPRWESGNLLLKQGMVELEDQMSRFPVGKKVDILDALAMQEQVMEPQFVRRDRVYYPREIR